MVHSGAKAPDTLVEEAIVRVLEAELAARTATEAARGHAAARVEAARRAAGEIERRAERRIVRTRSAFERHVAAARRKVEAEIDALTRSGGEDGALLHREADAVETLVAELTGGDHD